VPNGHTTAFGALDPLEFGRRSSFRDRLAPGLQSAFAPLARRVLTVPQQGKERDVASTMSATEHRGWLIDPRSYKGDDEQWCPRALVSRVERGRFCTHDVRALLSMTFDSAWGADDYAIKMAKTWIEDRDYRPLSPITSFATPSRS
jgi:hypothetical protein